MHMLIVMLSHSLVSRVVFAVSHPSKPFRRPCLARFTRRPLGFDKGTGHAPLLEWTRLLIIIRPRTARVLTIAAYCQSKSAIRRLSLHGAERYPSSNRSRNRHLVALKSGGRRL
ncbi:hypothetical protein L210DRAFT_2133613 [Boletus edulis BED1]|uniref:Secreted protein n=1 Tax=Boletus edulis BED1 TaxID=1328754 RepID=A0AAD4G859_BOLED|nr:hypothetical protein L210DRAFT_2133613 [Boletus edulis BED1]